MYHYLENGFEIKNYFPNNDIVLIINIDSNNFSIFNQLEDNFLYNIYFLKTVKNFLKTSVTFFHLTESFLFLES